MTTDTQHQPLWRAPLALFSTRRGRTIAAVAGAWLVLMFVTYHHVDRDTLAHHAEPLLDTLDKWRGGTGTAPAKVSNVGKTVIHELAIHDEVLGALAYSLDQAGVEVEFRWPSRFGFKDVLAPLLSYEPDFKPGVRRGDEFAKYMETEGADVANLILNTCTDALPANIEAIQKSKAHVFCVVHHPGGPMNLLHDSLLPLLRENRVTLLTLGQHVLDAVRADLQEWAYRNEEKAFETAPVELFIPVFNYAPNKTYDVPEVFPRSVVIQGNIEPLRRNYDGFLKDLLASLKDDPKHWGYRWDAEASKYVAIQADAFTVHLLGQLNKNNPLHIPPELVDLIKIHQNTQYSEFYNIVAATDLIVPAFNQRGSLTVSASSTMPAALIARTPVLLSERILAAYTYIRPPAQMLREISQGEIHAIENLRRGNGKLLRSPPASLEHEWDVLQADVQKHNADIWTRYLQGPV